VFGCVRLEPPVQSGPIFSGMAFDFFSFRLPQL